MFKSIINIWEQLSSAGNRFYFTKTEQKQNLIVNKTHLFIISVAFYTTAFSAIIVIDSLAIDKVKYANSIHCLLLAVYVLVFLLITFIVRIQIADNRKRMSMINFTFVGGLLYLTTISILMGPKAGTWMFIFALIPLPFMYSTSKQKKSLIINEALIGLSIAVVIYSNRFLDLTIALPEKYYTITFYHIICLLYFGLMTYTYFFWRQTFITEERLGELAYFDPLTGALNRRKFQDLAKTELYRFYRYHSPLTLSLVDLDYFKSVNDKHGHDVGDYVLKEFASIIKDNIRPTDHFVRWGGEEFIILLSNTSLEQAKLVCEKLRKMIETHKFEYIKRLTISMGLTDIDKNEDLAEVIKRADQAMYIAKAKGRNRLEVVSKKDNQLE